MITTSNESSLREYACVRDNDTVETEVTVLEKTPKALLVCNQDDFDCECPLWLPRRKIKVVQGKLSKNEVITIHVKEDFAIEQGLSY